MVRDGLGGLNGATVTSGGFVDKRFVNLASNSLSGVDFQGDHHTDMSDLGLGANGSLTFRLVGTLTTTVEDHHVPGPAGVRLLRGSSARRADLRLPTWRHQFRVTWETLWDVTLYSPTGAFSRT